jgi:hypothetical protein
MSKCTVRANARTLPEATNRRAVLGAVLAVGAIGVVPIAAGAATAAEPVSGPVGLDVGLFSIIDQAREAGARVEAAVGALEEAQDRTEEVPWPQAVIVTEDDTRLWWKLKAGDRFHIAHLSQMRDNQQHRQKLKDSISRLPPGALDALGSGLGPMDDKGRARIEKMKAQDAREDQIIAAMDRLNEASQVARDRSGETAASDVVDQVWDEKYAAYTRVANTRARTLSGVLAKLAFIAPDFDDESASELPGEMGTSPEILFSIAVDFKELKARQALSGENASV